MCNIKIYFLTGGSAGCKCCSWFAAGCQHHAHDAPVQHRSLIFATVTLLRQKAKVTAQKAIEKLLFRASYEQSPTSNIKYRQQA